MRICGIATPQKLQSRSELLAQVALMTRATEQGVVQTVLALFAVPHVAARKRRHYERACLERSGQPFACLASCPKLQCPDAGPSRRSQSGLSRTQNLRATSSEESLSICWFVFAGNTSLLRGKSSQLKDDFASSARRRDQSDGGPRCKSLTGSKSPSKAHRLYHDTL